MKVSNRDICTHGCVFGILYHLALCKFFGWMFWMEVNWYWTDFSPLKRLVNFFSLKRVFAKFELNYGRLCYAYIYHRLYRKIKGNIYAIHTTFNSMGACKTNNIVVHLNRLIIYMKWALELFARQCFVRVFVPFFFFSLFISLI